MRGSIAIAMLATFSVPTAALGSDWVYNPSTGNSYRLTADELTWYEAEDEAIAAGGHLVAINDAAENQWLVDTFGPRASPQTSLWIGLFQPAGSVEPDGGWMWTTGEPFVYENWRDGEPNNDTPDEDGGEFYVGPDVPGPTFPGHWNDETRTLAPWPGIIERSGPPPASEVPAVSDWGVVAMTLVLLTTGTIVLRPKARIA